MELGCNSTRTGKQAESSLQTIYPIAVIPALRLVLWS